MLTALELENFKGFGPRQRIEFAPITLLFGANSAGKSTIIQSLLYLQALLERGEANVDRTDLGGKGVDLGGFARLVHRLDVKLAIKIRAEFRITGTLERFGRLDDEIAFPDLDDSTESAWIEFTVRSRMGEPIVDEVAVGLGPTRDPIVTIEWAHPHRVEEGRRARIDMTHPALGPLGREVAEAWARVAQPEPAATAGHAKKTRSARKNHTPVAAAAYRPVFLLQGGGGSALPPLLEPIRVVSPARSTDTGQSLVELRSFLEMVVLGTARQLSAYLSEMLYVGPLRAVPPRGYLYERTSRPSSWADGLAAWDMLLRDRGKLVTNLNSWLSQSRLGVNCEVEVHDLVLPYEDIDGQGGLDDITIDGAWNVRDRVRRLALRVGPSLVLPSEVGTGVSQLIPVVVASILPKTRLIVLEQPELHVHPAVQVGLGDLFIEASRDRSLIIETHSEHLILRLMRRIRETWEHDQSSLEGEQPLELPSRRKKSGRGDPKQVTRPSRIDTVSAKFPLTPDRVSVMYVEPNRDGVRISRLRVGDDGQFQDLWPRGFFDERFEELYGSTS